MEIQSIVLNDNHEFAVESQVIIGSPLERIHLRGKFRSDIVNYEHMGEISSDETERIYNVRSKPQRGAYAFVCTAWSYNAATDEGFMEGRIYASKSSLNEYLKTLNLEVDETPEEPPEDE